MEPTRHGEYVQPSSPFFNLPLEVRHEIYGALLHLAGPTQHIYKTDVGDSAAVTHTRCLIDPDEPDVREVTYAETFSAELHHVEEVEENWYEQTLWWARQNTDWCNHWACEENTSEDHDNSVSAFLGPLLTCKRMHDEFADMLYSGTTFSFIGLPAMHRFLTTTAPRCLELIRSVHLTWYSSTPRDQARWRRPSHCARKAERSMRDLDPDETGWNRGSIERSAVVNARDRDAGLDNIFNWEMMWYDVAARCPALDRARVWVYPRTSRTAMPEPDYFQVLDEFADGTLRPIVVRDGDAGPRLMEARPPRVMREFTVRIVGALELGPVTVDGQEVEDDDGESVPDWLRGRRFTVTREKAMVYEDPALWTALWANPLAGRADIFAKRAQRNNSQGWGLRATKLVGEDGRALFPRI